MQGNKMQEILSLAATLAVLVALSGVLPIVSVVSAIAQEARPTEVARSVAPTKKHRAETIDVDRLTLDSDFTIFMRHDCPPELRLRALRKLWTLLPPAPIDDSAPI
jgi:hypothetical protein